MLGLPSPEENPPSLPPAATQSDGIDPAAIIGMVSKLQSFNADDDNIRFILALKPLLSEDKRQKADRAVKLMKIINLLPLIKESGILGGDLLGIL